MRVVFISLWDCLDWLRKERACGNEQFFRASDVQKKFKVSYAVARRWLMSLFRAGFLEVENRFVDDRFFFPSGFRAKPDVNNDFKTKN